MQVLSLVRTLPVFFIGLAVGIVGVLVSLFVAAQFSRIDSDDFRFIPKTAWFERYPVDCIEDLCNVKWLASYYDSSVLSKRGNLEGADFQTTTLLVKKYFADSKIEVTDVRYVMVIPSNCEFGECFDDYAIEFQVRGDEGIRILREFAERPSEKPNALG